MKRSIFHPTHPVAATAICLAGICFVASVNLQAKDIQVGRYSLLAATPTDAQANLLATTITVSFPARIVTVGEAVQYLLQRSGYRLVTGPATGPETADLLTLPLPAVHRRLGPVSLTQALETLVGPAFRLIHDPVHRLVSFELCTATGRVTQQTSSMKPEGPRNGE
ncbi:MAG: pili assembly chaperone [Gammaproteobacteria bacterium]|nr:pili assembly chaperone [Gammaproteobacteria bacterium]